MHGRISKAIGENSREIAGKKVEEITMREFSMHCKKWTNLWWNTARISGEIPVVFYEWNLVKYVKISGRLLEEYLYEFTGRNP